MLSMIYRCLSFSIKDLIPYPLYISSHLQHGTKFGFNLHWSNSLASHKRLLLFRKIIFMFAYVCHGIFDLSNKNQQCRASTNYFFLLMVLLVSGSKRRTLTYYLLQGIFSATFYRSPQILE